MTQVHTIHGWRPAKLAMHPLVYTSASSWLVPYAEGDFSMVRIIRGRV